MLGKLKGKPLEAAARLQSNKDYGEVVSWMNSESINIAVACAREIDIDEARRLQGEFRAIDDLVNKLLSARDAFNAERESDKRRRQEGL